MCQGGGVSLPPCPHPRQWWWWGVSLPLSLRGAASLSPACRQGKKFLGDLLPDGKITWQETGQVFNSPSAWATYCKKLVNPAKKSGCGWASVKYKGQKLDQYKAAWLKKHQPNAPAAEEVSGAGHGPGAATGSGLVPVCPCPALAASSPGSWGGSHQDLQHGRFLPHGAPTWVWG